MITNFQKRKLVNLFNIHDINSNGQLEYADFEQKTAQLAAMHGWAAGSEPYQLLLERFGRFWEGLLAADTNGDGVISYEEWWAWWEQIMDHGLYEQVAQPIGSMIFSMCDPEGTGMVSEANFFRFFQANTGSDARDVFKHLDTDGSGSLSLDNLSTALHEFFYSNDHNAPGNWLFGRV